MAEKTINPMVVIQTKLNAPKNQRNNFGNYNYRSCEDILEAVKPLLKETNCSLNLTDDIQIVGDRIYVKATATLTEPDGKIHQASAFAREPLSKKGMDDSQVTGAASSYARKYALNGLLCIDDNKDADVPLKETAEQQPSKISDKDVALIAINQSQSESELLSVWNSCTHEVLEAIKPEFSKRRAKLQKGGSK